MAIIESSLEWCSDRCWTGRKRHKAVIGVQLYRPVVDLTGRFDAYRRAAALWC